MSGNRHKKNEKKLQKKQFPWLWVILGLIAVGLAIFLIFFNGQNPEVGALQNPPVNNSENVGTVLPDTVSVQEASEQFAEGAFLLDVREQSEWNEAHVEGAVLIPLGELSSRISEIPTGQDVLIICRSGNRSGQARDLLREAGLPRTTSISGGITAWMAAGLPVVTGP